MNHRIGLLISLALLSILAISTPTGLMIPSYGWQSSKLISEYDEFNDFTKIKTEKLLVYEPSDSPDRIQLTFMTFHKGKKVEPVDEVAVAMGALLSKRHLRFSTSVKVVADDARLDLGNAGLLDEEQQGEQIFQSYGWIIPAEKFKKMAQSKVLKMQIGGVLAFTLSEKHCSALKALSEHVASGR